MKPTINVIRDDQERDKQMNKETNMFEILNFDCPEHFRYTKESLKPSERAFLDKALYLIENHMIMGIVEAEDSGMTRQEVVESWDSALAKVLNGDIR
jgi:hypothetical protein